MKCVKKGTEVLRVTEEKAKEMVTNGWKWASKKEWKEGGRKR